MTAGQPWRSGRHTLAESQSFRRRKTVMPAKTCRHAGQERPALFCMTGRLSRSRPSPRLPISSPYTSGIHRFLLSTILRIANCELDAGNGLRARSRRQLLLLLRAPQQARPARRASRVPCPGRTGTTIVTAIPSHVSRMANRQAPYFCSVSCLAFSSRLQWRSIVVQSDPLLDPFGERLALQVLEPPALHLRDPVFEGLLGRS